ncbi:PIN domain-containing protein [Paraphysoderma sedebokerense]|nr:PIN domain-containing protein [Paraphysoderma sedebokerense]KAI9141708.1 PIN domain-containing protein [Paraphysoderma sedebokerense]
MDRQNLLPKSVDVVPMDIDDDNIRHVIRQEITEFRSVHKDFSPAKSPAFHPKLEGAAPEFSPSSQHEYRPDEMDVDFDDFIQVIESHDIASSGFGLTVEHGENIYETVGIVVDTNWLLSHGGWLHELLGLLSTYQLSRVYVCVPWICLAELDGIQKSNKRSTGGISAIARKAIKWLYALFRRKTTGLKGQKISECISAELQCNDDKILDYCRYLSAHNWRTVLLSEDNNLCVKALVHGIDTMSKADDAPSGFLHKIAGNYVKVNSNSNSVISDTYHYQQEILNQVNHISASTPSLHSAVAPNNDLSATGWEGLGVNIIHYTNDSLMDIVNGRFQEPGALGNTTLSPSVHRQLSLPSNPISFQNVPPPQNSQEHSQAFNFWSFPNDKHDSFAGGQIQSHLSAAASVNPSITLPPYEPDHYCAATSNKLTKSTSPHVATQTAHSAGSVIDPSGQCYTNRDRTPQLPQSHSMSPGLSMSYPVSLPPAVSLIYEMYHFTVCVVGFVVVSELRKRLGEDWPFVVISKPPWSLSGLVSMLERHWISVFTDVLPRPLKSRLPEYCSFTDTIESSLRNYNLQLTLFDPSKYTDPKAIPDISNIDRDPQLVRGKLYKKDATKFLNICRDLTIGCHEQDKMEVIRYMKEWERRLQAM